MSVEENTMKWLESIATVAGAVVLTGCGVFMSEVSQERDALTPEQAKAQVIDAVHELKTVLGIPIEKALVYLSSCNDQGEAPFRGAAAVHYPLAPSRDAALAETAGYLKTLQAAGWTIPPDPDGLPQYEARKSGVRVFFEVQGVGETARVITVNGQCRDVTTTKATQGTMEPIAGI